MKLLTVCTPKEQMGIIVGGEGPENGGCASHPGIGFMKGWSEEEIKSYCQWKNWQVKESKVLSYKDK